MSDKVFANGIIYKEPSDKAPNFVVGGLSIKKSEFIPFLNTQTGDWVNLKINIGKSGKPYVELDTWKPNSSQSSGKTEQEEISNVDVNNNDDLPFS